MSRKTSTSTNQPTATVKPAFVDVFARTKQDGSVEFSHEWRWGETGPSEGKGAITIPPRTATEPGTKIHFLLKDLTDPERKLEFCENQGATMWVRRGSCPLEDEKCDDPQIPSDQMHTEPKHLKVSNLNSEKCTLHYRLWFKDKDGQMEAYDPEITNGGKI